MPDRGQPIMLPVVLQVRAARADHLAGTGIFGGGDGPMDLTATASARVLLVGAESTTSQLKQTLGCEGWLFSYSPGPAGVLSRLRGQSDIDLVVLVPDTALRPYTELCRQIKFDRRTTFVSVVFVLQGPHADHCTEAFTAGADDCIKLPASPAEVRLRLANAYRVKRATDSLEDAGAVITSLANAVEGRDAYTRGHVERVSAYAVEIGQHLGVSAEVLAALRVGGIVHDIGKVAVPDQILNKPGKLTDEEMDLIKRHPLVGYDILQPLRTFREVLPIVRWHHERPNGTGYPDGLRGDQLPLPPRIVAVADVFDALSTARSYRPAFSPPKCREILITAAAKGDLDATAVAVLLQRLGESAAVLDSAGLDGEADLALLGFHA